MSFVSASRRSGSFSGSIAAVSKDVDRSLARIDVADLLRLAALAAFLYRKARLSARAAGMGAVSFLQLEAPNGRICAVGGGSLVLVVVAESSVNVGLVRVELLRAVDALRDAGGGEGDA